MSKESDKMAEFERLLYAYVGALVSGGKGEVKARAPLLEWARAALREPKAEPFGYVIRGHFYFNREHAESRKRNLAPLADIVPVYTHPKADAEQRDGCALDVRADLPMTLARSIGFLEGQIYALQNYVIVDDRPELKDVLKLLQVELESLRKEPK